MTSRANELASLKAMTRAFYEKTAGGCFVAVAFVVFDIVVRGFVYSTGQLAPRATTRSHDLFTNRANELASYFFEGTDSSLLCENCLRLLVVVAGLIFDIVERIFVH